MSYSPNPAHIHLWLPNIFGFKGGIQVYSLFFLQALQRACPNTWCEIFLKHDTQFYASMDFSYQTRFHFSGNFPIQVRTFAYAFQLLKSGLLQKPDLVITTHLNFSPVAYWLKRIAGIPYWIVAHGEEAWNLQHKSRKTALCNADKILSVSSYTRDRLLKEQALSTKQISLLPNTFEPKHYQIAPKPRHLLERYGLSAEQPIILTVSRLDETRPYKGYYPVLRTLPRIRHQIPDVHYIIVGKGGDLPNIERLIAQLDLQDSVTLAGFIPDEELPDHYNLCDLFAMPSKGEGFGIVYQEALACGKPALGSCQDGAIDALAHGELGVLVDPDNEEAIANITVEILQKHYPKPILYQPERLRQKTIETYGFTQFQQTLTKLIRSQFQV